MLDKAFIDSLNLSDHMEDVRGKLNEIILESIELIDTGRDFLNLTELVNFIDFDSLVNFPHHIWMAQDLSFNDKSLSIWVLG